MFKWAIKRSIDKRAHLVQLTTDKQRPDAISFTEHWDSRIAMQE